VSREARTRHRLAQELFASLRAIMRDDLELSGVISYRVCEEIIIHLRRDTDRLFVTHHRLVHPTKHCSYLAFWIRKLKPVSRAYPISVLENLDPGDVPDPEFEDSSVNEKLCLLCAIKNLHTHISEGHIHLPSGREKDKILQQYASAVANYFNHRDVADAEMGDRFQSLVYDLRFRTFGPHHLTHVLVHILRETLV
jgi:hypothetical protein